MRIYKRGAERNVLKGQSRFEFDGLILKQDVAGETV